MTEALSIREASNDDFALLPEIERSADILFKNQGIGPLPPAASERELRKAMKILVAGKPPQGFARIENIDGSAHLEQLSVKPEAMGRGLGTRLLEAACDWAKAKGYPAIISITFQDVPWNGPFYAKNGFTKATDPSPGIIKLIEHEKEIGLDKLGARVVMVKEL